jgi:predicted nucleic acid-binding protein
VQNFFKSSAKQNIDLFISAITVGELRRGVERIRNRNDIEQANTLENWLNTIVEQYDEYILSFTKDEAQIWGKLRASHPENAQDKQIAATALAYGLTVVTRNEADFKKTGVKVLNPFSD